MTQRRGGYVYFVQNERTGLIKIGTTKNVEHRIKQLCSEYKANATLLGFVWGRFTLEAELHRRFAAYCERGEWFAPSDELLTFIAGSTHHKLPRPEQWEVDPQSFAEAVAPFIRKAVHATTE
jgi:Meiotically Up-regulated Gene 113 (MUG113) protein